MSDHEDEILLEKAREGDMAAFKMLVERYQGKVAGVVTSMLGSTPESLDVGQEVFIRFYESMNKFKGESALGTYLVRIAINLTLNEIKRMKKRNSLFIPIDFGKKQMANTGDNSDIKDMVQFEISKLDSEFRVVVSLRMIEGYSTDETAEILGIP